MKSFHILFSLLFSFAIFTSCLDHKENGYTPVQSNDLERWNNPSYRLHGNKIRHVIDSLQKEQTRMYADEYVRRYYTSEAPFLWITRSGVGKQADSLLSCIEKFPAYGISTQCFHTEDIKEDLRRIRNLDFNTENEINAVFGRIEYRLTQTLLRYACGQRYGYLRPDKILNHLEQSDTLPDSPFKVLYDIPTEYADEAFVQKVLSEQQNGSLTTFLHSIQPDNPVYRCLTEIYRKATTTDSQEKIAVNIERSRWRSPLPSQKFVWVNLAGMTLFAINEKEKNTLEMKVCVGNFKHKSPMLFSQIERMDLNPYWMIPYSIVKKEIAPRYAQNEAYFSRNRIRIFDKETGEEMEPQSVTASMLTSGNYRLQQDNGEGNSLGRLIFRFPNNFSVFLHDTDNKAAFKRNKRAVSHGCIRVEKPLELALFLWENTDKKAIDELRMAIGLPPLHDKSYKKEKTEEENGRPLKVGTRKFNTPIPIFIHYYTVYPDIRNGVNDYPDIYGYDDVLLKKIKAI